MQVSPYITSSAIILKFYRKAPVFVNSIETAVELTSTFADRKSVLMLLSHLRSLTLPSDCVPFFESRTLLGMVSITSVRPFHLFSLAHLYDSFAHS